MQSAVKLPPATVGELHDARRLMRRLFGDAANIFYDAGLWHLGRFTDNLGQVKPDGPDKVSPHRRPQEVFAVAATLTEAMSVFTGPGRVYSIAGVAPGARAHGYRVVYDKYGRLRGYKSPAGVFSRRFPGEPGQWS